MNESQTPAPTDTGPPDATAGGTPRGPSLLRGLAITVLVVVLLFLAFVGGGVVSATLGMFDQLREAETRTEVRPQPSVVVAVRELARLETTTFHIQRVIDLSEEQSRLWGVVKQKDSILLVAAADISAGVDLAKLRDDDVRVSDEGRTVRLTLPPPEVLSTVLDSERTYVHSRSTDVLAVRREDLETRARAEAEATLRDAALDAGLLDRAKSGAERSLQTLLRSLGYETVEIRWR